MNIDSLLNNAIIVDIETWAEDNQGREVNIKTNKDLYLQLAQVRWVGIYCFKEKKEYYLEVSKDRQKILNLLNTYPVLIGFNSEEFDHPILCNNGLIAQNKYVNHVDCMKILGSSSFKDKNGFKYKGRGDLMGYKFKNNSLQCMAETMELDFQKSTIDYKIFKKVNYTEQEKQEIIKYLRNDILATKGLFEKLWTYWMPFTDMLDWKYIENFSWIKSSIASLIYKSACHEIGVEPTYSEKKGKLEQMGGRVLNPIYEEAKNVWYVDFSSLYPHVMTMFNLFAETSDKEKGWHGNNLFKTRGYYDISHKHPLVKVVENKLKQRIELKKMDKDNPLVYTLKIWLNCFSKDTKILMADNTIKNIYDCKIGDLIYSINPKSLNVEKKKIIKKFEYDYRGEMHHYISNYFDFFVTPNHRFLVEHQNNSKIIKFVESKDVESQFKLPIHKKNKQKYKKILNILDYLNKEDFLYSFKPSIHGRTWLVNNALSKLEKTYNCTDRNFIFSYDIIKNKLNRILKNKDSKFYILDKNHRFSHKKPIFYDNNALSYLIGIYLSEGSLSYVLPKKYENGNYRGDIYTVSLSQYKKIHPEIYDKIITALIKCGLKYSAGKQNIKISGSIFYNFIEFNFGKKEFKHFKNKNMFNDLNLEKVFEGLIDGDGSKKHCLYTTKYDCLKNDFIELCMRLGYTFNIKNDGCWRINYNNNKNSFRKANREIKQYNDKVYCVEVEDNNTLFVSRNGKFHWSGNSLYGASRSSIFEKIHTPNIGWDTAFLGRQIQEFAQKELENYGFQAIAGDTDSLFVVSKEKKHNDKDYIRICLKSIVKKILENVPFPSETFNIDIEDFIYYITFPFSEEPIVEEEIRKKLNKKMIEGYEQKEIDKKKCIIRIEDNKIVKKGRSWIKERRGKKKNYLYIKKEKDQFKIEIVGLPIKKDGATPLGMKFYKEILEPRILKEKTAKFSKKFIDKNLEKYLQNKDILKLLAREFKVKPFKSYKIPEGQIEPTGIHAQISKHYFNGGDGVISLIKNNKCGKVGKGSIYCTVEEAINNKLTLKDLEIEKVYKELEPFIKYEKEEALEPIGIK